MLKNSVSIAIIIIAVVIIFFNFSDKEEKPQIEAVTTTEEAETPARAQAPDFSLETLDGTQLALSDLKGQKVLLNFWATWCAPCKAEMPHMQSFYEKYKDKNVTVIAVNLQDSRDKLASFVEEYGLTFPISLDTTGEIGSQYKVFTIPTSYFIDEQGGIVQKIVGPMDEEFMEGLITSY
ncbi:TlpA disulfide reductase family protein [Solibacillus sp. CAU 1738]|uniref:TlpA family protein disulfide reductase n=1 Tax=Solibacillus sp. CAU 1738 TaxID=3140363 RepID=UPI0032619DC0